jgi:hypothetical protein
LWLVLAIAAVAGGAGMIKFEPSSASSCCAPPSCADALQGGGILSRLRLRVDDSGRCDLRNASYVGNGSADSPDDAYICPNVTADRMGNCTIRQATRRVSYDCGLEKLGTGGGSMSIIAGVVLYLPAMLRVATTLRTRGGSFENIGASYIFGYMLHVPALVIACVLLSRIPSWPSVELVDNAKFADITLPRTTTTTPMPGLPPPTTLDPADAPKICFWKNEQPVRITTVDRGELNMYMFWTVVAIAAHGVAFLSYFIACCSDPDRSLTREEARRIMDTQIPDLLNPPAWDAEGRHRQTARQLAATAAAGTAAHTTAAAAVGMTEMSAMLSAGIAPVTGRVVNGDSESD